MCVLSAHTIHLLSVGWSPSLHEYSLIYKWVNRPSRGVWWRTYIARTHHKSDSIFFYQNTFDVAVLYQRERARVCWMCCLLCICGGSDSRVLRAIQRDAQFLCLISSTWHLAWSQSGSGYSDHIIHIYTLLDWLTSIVLKCQVCLWPQSHVTFFWYYVGQLDFSIE